MTSEPVNQPGPPDDLEQLQAEIEQTREHLGDTVDQLAAKADVKAQAQAKAADLTQRAKDTAGQARQHAADTVGQVRQQAADTATQARQRAAAAAATGQEQLQARTPEGVKQAASARPGESSAVPDTAAHCGRCCRTQRGSREVVATSMIKIIYKLVNLVASMLGGILEGGRGGG